MSQLKRTHRVSGVAPHSPAARMGVQQGDQILSINGEELIDEIDYQYLSSARHIELGLLRDGQPLTLTAKKSEWTPLGLCFDGGLLGKTRVCANNCVFCFVDQMPPGLRETLYVKDDDWRMSLMYGQYITLTNVTEREFERILRREASPLYISVHATDPAVRIRMMKHPGAGVIMDRLGRIRDAGLTFHAQIVLCPGYNDGAALDRTLADLSSLYPAIQSAAMVPVGMTCHRQGLAELTPFDRESAGILLDQAGRWQQKFLAEFGTRLVFPSDEFYCLAKRTPPDDEAYEEYPQIENGVGMLRTLEREYLQARQEAPNTRAVARDVLIACGVSVAPFLAGMLKRYPIPGIQPRFQAVENTFFGKTITVSGLLTGQDLVHALRGVAADEILITRSMLREGQDVFLDDMTLDQLIEAVGKPIHPVAPEGEALYNALIGRGGTE